MSVRRAALEEFHLTNLVHGLLECRNPSLAPSSSSSCSQSSSSRERELPCERDWRAELLSFARCKAAQTISVIEEHLLNLVHTTQAEDVLIRKSTILCALINDILGASRERETIGLVGGSDECALHDELSLNNLLRTILSVRSNVRLSFPEGHTMLTDECGKIVVTVSHLYPSTSLGTCWDLLEKALEDSGWERGVLPVAEMLGYLSLDVHSLSRLITCVWGLFQNKTLGKKSSSEYLMTTLKSAASFASSHVSDLHGHGNMKAEKSDRHSTLLIVISSYLRGCVLRWICYRPGEYAGLFEPDETEEEHMRLHSSCKIETNYDSNSNNGRIKLPFDKIKDLLVKMELLATGITKRLYLWPTLVVFSCLLPCELQRAIDSPTTEVTVVDKIMRWTAASLRPSALQKTIDKHAQVFAELSVISYLYLMMINTAVEMETKRPGLLESYISPNLPKLRDILVSGEMLSAPFVLKISQLCKDNNIWQPTLSVHASKTLLYSFLLSIGPKNEDIFDSILCIGFQNFSKYLFVRSTVLSTIQTLLRCVSITRPLLEAGHFHLSSLPKKMHVVQYARQIIMSDLSYHSLTYREGEDVMRDLINQISSQKEYEYLKTSNLRNEPMPTASCSASSGASSVRRETLSLLPYDESMLEYLQQYLSFLAETVGELFFRDHNDSLPHMTGNIFFPTVVDAFLCRTVMDLLSLYQTDIDIVRLLAEQAFVNIFDVKNFSKSVSVNTFFGLILYTLHRLVSTLWCESVNAIPSLLRALYTVLGTFNAVASGGSCCRESVCGNLSTITYHAITSVEAILFRYLSHPNPEVLSNVLKCLGQIGVCVNQLLEKFSNNMHEDLGLVYEDIYGRHASSIEKEEMLSRKRLSEVFADIAMAENEIVNCALNSRVIKVISFLDQTTYFSQGMLLGLGEVYKRWKDFTFSMDSLHTLIGSEGPATKSEDDMFEWNNESFLLCSLGIVRNDTDQVSQERILEYTMLVFTASSMDVELPNPCLISRDTVNNSDQVILFLRAIVTHWFSATSSPFTESSLLYIGKILQKSFVESFVGQVLLDELKQSPILMRNKGRQYPMGIGLDSIEDFKAVPFTTEYDSIMMNDLAHKIPLSKSVSVATNVLLILELFFERITKSQDPDMNMWLRPQEVEELFLILLRFSDTIDFQLDIYRSEAQGCSGKLRNSSAVQGGCISSNVDLISINDCHRIKRKVANSILNLLGHPRKGCFSVDFIQAASDYMISWLKPSMLHINDHPVEMMKSESSVSQAMELSCIRAFGALTLLAPISDVVFVNSDVVGFCTFIDDCSDHETIIVAEGHEYEKDQMWSKRLFKIRMYLHLLTNVSKRSSSLECKLAVVRACANVLSRNPSIAFPMFLEEATYNHTDQIRTIYLQALQIGLANKLQFGTTQTSRVESYLDGLKKLQHLLVSDTCPRSLLKCLVSISDGQQYNVVISCLVKAYSESGILLILRSVVSDELERCSSLNTLFRTDSFATRFISTLMYTHATDYLVEALGDIVNEFISSDLNLEVVPSKIMLENNPGKSLTDALNVLGELIGKKELQSGSIEESVGQNLESLKLTVSRIFESILASYGECPIFVRQILEVIKMQTRIRFPDDIVASDRVSIGGVFFLRFLCPTLVQPLGIHGFLTDANKARMQSMSTVKRNLILVVKVLQQLSNGSSFSDKNFQPLNEWLSFHSSAISGFCSKISSLSPDADILNATDMDGSVPDRFSQLKGDSAWMSDIVGRSMHENCRHWSTSDSSPVSALIQLHGYISQRHKEMCSVLADSTKDALSDILAQIQDVPVRRHSNFDLLRLDTDLFICEDGAIDLFVHGIENDPSFMTTMGALQSSMALYGVNFRPSLGIPSTIFIVLRRMSTLQIENTDMVVYLLLHELSLITRDPGKIDVVIDCSLYNRDCFLKDKGSQLWGKFFQVISRSSLVTRINKMYILYPSSEAKKLGALFAAGPFGPRGGEEDLKILCEKVIVVSQAVAEKLDPLLVRHLPSLTQSIYDGLGVKWPAAIMSKPVLIGFSHVVCTVEQSDTLDLLDSSIEFTKVDMISLNSIKKLSVESRGGAAVLESLKDASLTEFDAIGDKEESHASSGFHTRRFSESRMSISESISGGNLLGLAVSNRKSYRSGEISVVAITYCFVNEEEGGSNGSLGTIDKIEVSPRSPNGRSKSFGFTPTTPTPENHVYNRMNSWTKSPSSSPTSSTESKKGEIFRYYSTYGSQIEAAFVLARSRFEQHSILVEAVGSSQIRGYMRPESVAGSLYHTAWLGVLSSNQLTARAAYSLLGATVSEFDQKNEWRVFPHPVSGIPHVPIDFLVGMSNNLSKNRPEYAIEIFTGCAKALDNNNLDGLSKAVLLNILKPWIPLLRYVDRGEGTEIAQGSRASDSLRDTITRWTENDHIAQVELVREGFRSLLLGLINSETSRDALIVVSHTDLISEIANDRYLSAMSIKILLERLLEIEREESVDRIAQNTGDFMSSEYVFRNSLCSEQSVLMTCHSENDCVGSKNNIKGIDVFLSHSQTYYGWSDEMGSITGIFHAFLKPQAVQIEELLVDGVMALLAHLDDCSPSTSWLPVMASFRALISLPFQSYEFVERCLHKFLHIIIMACSVKNTPAVIRVGCHSLLASIMYTIQAEANSATSTSEEKWGKELMQLQELTENLSSTSASLLSFSMTASNCDEMVNSINSIMSLAGRILPDLRQVRANWLELAYQVCRMESPISLSTGRCFVVCSVLMQQEDTTKSILFSSALLSLKANLAEESDKSETIQHVFYCLIRMVPFINQEQLLDMFWVAILTVQLASIETYSVCFHLLVAVLERIDSERSKDSDLLRVLENSRVKHKHKNFEGCIQKVECQYIGLTFVTREDIAMSLCASVLKGVQLPESSSLLQRITSMLDMTKMPLGCLPLLMLSATDSDNTDEDLNFSKILLAHLYDIDKSKELEKSLDSPGFKTAPNSPFPAPSELISPTTSTLREDNGQVARSPFASKKQLFPVTPVKSVDPLESKIHSGEKATLIMGTPGTIREGHIRQTLGEADRRVVLFTALICAAVKGSQNVNFLRHGYAMLQEMSKLPTVVKYMYSAIFPELTTLLKKASLIQQKDREIATLIQGVIEGFMVTSFGERCEDTEEERHTLALLQDMGFHEIMNAGSFQSHPCRQLVNKKGVIEAISNLLEMSLEAISI